jgi:ATP-binding protein involved in chromosome partitioning
MGGFVDASRRTAAPVSVDLFPNGEIGIVWQDGHESIYEPRALRCLCRCAACIDEVTGRKILDDASVPADLRALNRHAVGNYGIQFVWSDGHASGIYAHALLREMCRCGSCGTGAV